MEKSLSTQTRIVPPKGMYPKIPLKNHPIVEDDEVETKNRKQKHKMNKRLRDILY